MQAAARSQDPAASTILCLGSGPSATRGDMVIVNLRAHALSAWAKSDAWSPDFLGEMDAQPDQWIHLGYIPPRAPFNCDAFQRRLDPEREQPMVELTFMALAADVPGSETPGLTALIPYDADRNYQVLLGGTVVISARKPR